MYVIIVSGVVVRLSHVEPKVSGWNPASYPFFFLFFSFLFCFDCLFFVVVVFEIYTFQSKDSIF